MSGNEGFNYAISLNGHPGLLFQVGRLLKFRKKDGGSFIQEGLLFGRREYILRL